jgi:beta-1,4-N-acetylglucosaminyltransferase
LQRRFFGLFHCSIVYVESFARVQSLSVSGRIMYHAADKFVVQWERLRAQYPRAVYAGVLC